MKKLFLVFTLWNVGRLVVLDDVLLVKWPGSISPKPETVNWQALDIPETVNVPLNPELPAPVVLIPLLILISSTLESTERSCGNSVNTFATFDAQWAWAINRKFLCSFSWFKVPDPK